MRTVHPSASRPARRPERSPDRSSQQSPASPADDPLALERQVCFALAVATREVLAVYRPVLEPLGLTHPQYLVMLALWDGGGRSPRSVKQLAETLALDSPTVSPLLKRLEALGYVTRTRDAADERRLSVELTDAGRALRERAEQVPPAVLAALGVDVGELEQLHSVLTRVIGLARSATGRPPDAAPARPPAS